MRPCGALALAALLLAPGALAAQDGAITSGVQARGYNFGDGLGVSRLSQISVPFAASASLGPLRLDLGSAYARTTVRDSTGVSTSFSGLTDARVRASYEVVRDAVVLTAMVNIPTGNEQLAFREFLVTGFAASNFLSVPVRSYGAGTMFTGGVAVARPVGRWNLGFSASLRASSSYQPFTDVASDIRYKQGLESRFRVAVDRLIGRSRLTTGFTFSTFANDEFRASNAATELTPGKRYIGEVELVAPAGSGRITAGAWNYYRSSAKGTAVSGKEDILSVYTAGDWPLSRAVRFRPMLEGRQWWPEGGKGTLVGAGAGLRVALAGSLAFLPAVRFDVGRIDAPAAPSVSLVGWAATALLRYTP